MSNSDQFDASRIMEDVITVRRKVYEPTDQIIEESSLDECGQLHSFDGMPAYRKFDPFLGHKELECWMYEGQLHNWPRDDPAEIVWDTYFKTVVQKSFYRHGVLHRDHNRAAKIWIEPTTGARFREEFWFEGKLHRDGHLPAIVEYSKNRGDKILKQEFYVHGNKIDRQQLQLKR